MHLLPVAAVFAQMQWTWVCWVTLLIQDQHFQYGTGVTYYIYLHDFVASDSNDGRVSTDMGVVIDFAHSGEAFLQSGTGITFSLSKRSFSSSPIRNGNRMIHQLLLKKTIRHTIQCLWSSSQCEWANH